MTFVERLKRRNLQAQRRIVWAMRDYGWHDGLHVMRTTGMRSARVLLNLRRLEQAGHVEVKWEDQPSVPEGRPKYRRRLYRLIPVVSRFKSRRQWRDGGPASSGDLVEQVREYVVVQRELTSQIRRVFADQDAGLRLIDILADRLDAVEARLDELQVHELMHELTPPEEDT
jgi:hypothetical protein